METAPNHAELRRETAVVMYELGATIIPLNGKRPVDAGWQKATRAERCDEAIAAAERGNIGMVCGEASGIDVVDIDSDDPEQTLRDLGLADVVTPTVRTGSGKLHLYFEYVPGLSNRVGVEPGVDLRTTGGLVVLPGSIHPDTNRPYEWIRGPETPLAPFPVCLRERWATKAPTAMGPAKDHAAGLDPAVRAQVKAQVAAEVADAVARLMKTPEGSRNNTLNTVAHALFLKANSGFADADEVEELLYDAASEAGLEPDEIHPTLASARSSVQGKGLPASDRSALVWAAGRAARRKLQLVEPPAAVERPRSYWISSAILDRRSTAAPLVKGLVYQGELVVPYGAPGSGKTFVVLNLALAIASGAPTWAGRKATGGQVIYVAGEGTRGILNRIRAWARHRPEGETAALDSLTERFRVVEGTPQFLKDQEWESFLATEVVGAVPQPRLVIFDTLSRCLAGQDENSAEAMSAAVERMSELKRHTGAAVFLVHHTGKDGQKERGSSALRGAADAMFKVTKDGDRVSVEFDKLKEADLPEEPLSFRLQGVDLGVDEDGDPIRSAIVNSTEQQKGSLSAAQIKALRALTQLDVGESRTFAQWMTEAGFTNKGTLHRAKDALIQRGAIVLYVGTNDVAKYSASEFGRQDAR